MAAVRHYVIARGTAHGVVGLVIRPVIIALESVWGAVVDAEVIDFDVTFMATEHAAHVSVLCGLVRADLAKHGHFVAVLQLKETHKVRRLAGVGRVLEELAPTSWVVDLPWTDGSSRGFILRQ